MDFSYSEKVENLRARVSAFMDQHIIPRVREYNEEVHAGRYPVYFMKDLRALAKEEET